MHQELLHSCSTWLYIVDFYFYDVYDDIGSIDGKVFVQYYNLMTIIASDLVIVSAVEDYYYYAQDVMDGV